MCTTPKPTVGEFCIHVTVYLLTNVLVDVAKYILGSEFS